MDKEKEKEKGKDKRKKCVFRVQDEDTDASLRQLFKSGLGRATVAAELLCLGGMAPFMYIEAGTFLEYGFYGWRSVWNFMDMVAYVNQACAVCNASVLRLVGSWAGFTSLGLFQQLNYLGSGMLEPAALCQLSTCLSKVPLEKQFVCI